MAIRVHVVVEGQTEEMFVNRVLRPNFDLTRRGIYFDARAVWTGRRRGRHFRGGISSYRQLKSDLETWMNEDKNTDAYFTTMIDLYGIGRLSDEFPGYKAARSMTDPYAKVRHIEECFIRDVEHARFIAYIQLHEFEAMLFTDVDSLGTEFPNCTNQIQKLKGLVNEFDNPELIDEGETTSPSKRIIAEIPLYKERKPSAAVNAVIRIGIHRIRECCRHLDEWLQRIEALAAQT